MALTTFTSGTGIASSPMNTNFTYLPPVGCVLPWLKSFTGVPGTLPEGYLECDGSVISDAESPLDGETLPDLNGDNQFLYGNSTSGSTKTEDFMPSHTHNQGSLKFATNAGNANADDTASFNSYSGNISGNTGSASAGTAWEGYSVVWIMRIK